MINVIQVHVERMQIAMTVNVLVNLITLVIRT